jgi:excisionase family DNA binding protein
MIADRLLNAKEIARWLGVSEQWVRDHATGGARPELPYTKLGGRLLFRREKIEEFIEMHSKGSAA